jgi:hypothetical protein
LLVWIRAIRFRPDHDRLDWRRDDDGNGRHAAVRRGPGVGGVSIVAVSKVAITWAERLTLSVASRRGRDG